MLAGVMRAREWSMADVARSVGVHRASVLRWLRGDATPSREAASTLADLGVPPRAWSEAA